MKCGKCGRSGHNVRTCKKKKAVKKKTKKKTKKKVAKRRCGKCGRLASHNARTCKSKKKTKKKVAKKKTKKKTTRKKKVVRKKTRGASTHSKSLAVWRTLKRKKMGGYIGATKAGNLSAKKWGIGISKNGLKVCTFWGKLWSWSVVKHKCKTFRTKVAAKAHYDKLVTAKSKRYALRKSR